MPGAWIGAERNEDSRRCTVTSSYAGRPAAFTVGVTTTRARVPSTTALTWPLWSVAHQSSQVPARSWTRRWIPGLSRCQHSSRLGPIAPHAIAPG